MANYSLLYARRFLSESSLTKLRPFSTSTSLFKEESKGYQLVDAKTSEPLIVDQPEKTVEEPPKFYLTELSGVPEEHRKNRLARISKPPKNAMQSGTNNTAGWIVQFDNRARWENNLMGWVSSGDPLSNLHIQFPTKEEAVNFCEKNIYPYYIEDEKKIKPRNKSYASNFSWNKRSRTSTK